MKQLVAVLASLGVAVSLLAAGPGGGETFQQADQAYREGRYQEAYDGYLQLVRSEGANGHLLYNLGNAAFRLNQAGRAILFYERARVLLPRDQDLAFNLGHVREQLRDVNAAPESFVGTAFFWLDALTLAELFWGFAAANFLFWGVMGARLISRAEWTYSLLFLLLAVWLLAGVSFGLKWRQSATDDRAIILPAEVSVLAGPDVRDTVLFKLHEGTIVHLERSEEGWSLIRLPDGKRGWLRAEGAETIAARDP